MSLSGYVVVFYMLVRTQHQSSLGGGVVFLCVYACVVCCVKLCYIIFVYGFENLMKIN